MPEPVRGEADAGAASQPPHQVIDRRIGQRTPLRAPPQVDEDVVRIQRPVLVVVEIVGIEPHQLTAGRDETGPATLGPGAVVVDPRHHDDMAAGDIEVLVSQPERLADANAFSRGPWPVA